MIKRLDLLKTMAFKKKLNIKNIIIWNRCGLTLAELLITAVILTLLTTAAFSFYLTQHKQWLVQDQISDMQQRTRATMSELVNTIRMAGYDLVDGISPITPYDQISPNSDSVVIRGNFERVHTTLWDDDTGMNQTLDIIHSTSIGFGIGSRFCLENSLGDREIHTIVNMEIDPSLDRNRLTLAEPLTHQFNMADTKISGLSEVLYYIDVSDPSNPTLLKKVNDKPPQAFANNIESLHLTYTLADGSTTGKPSQIDSVRLVTITLRGRTDTPDGCYPGDHYRRRTLTTDVKLRNLSIE